MMQGFNKVTFLVGLLYTAMKAEASDTCERWTEFSECSMSSRSGTQSRVRTCIVQDETVYEMETQECNTANCLKSSTEARGTCERWTEFSECSKSCGGGTQSRVRNCTVQDGTVKEMETQECNTANCSRLSAEASEICDRWTEFSECSMTCGGGTQSRVQTCTVQAETVKEEEIQECNTANCSRSSSAETRDGCESWKEFSKCSKSCGSGTQSRVRACTIQDETVKEMETQECNRASRSKLFSNSLVGNELSSPKAC